MEVILLKVRLHDRRNAAAPGRVSRASVPDVMVLDIRDFTTFFETRAPDEVVRYLDFVGWAKEAGFRQVRFEPLAGPTSAAIARK